VPKWEMVIHYIADMSAKGSRPKVEKAIEFNYLFNRQELCILIL